MGTFRAGPDGVRITWSDASVSRYPPYARFRIEAEPKRIEGRVYRLKDGMLGYEGPNLTS